VIPGYFQVRVVYLGKKEEIQFLRGSAKRRGGRRFWWGEKLIAAIVDMAVCHTKKIY
jgi:hypothetical protein